MMHTQDPRMTEDALEFYEGFLIAIAQNDNAIVREFLELEPTLIYARNELGGTAIQALILSGQRADLDTLRVILDITQQTGVLPDYEQTDNSGHDAYVSLQVHAGEPLNREFAAAIGVHLPARATQPAVYTEDEYAARRAAEDAYFDNNPRHDFMQNAHTVQSTASASSTPAHSQQHVVDKENLKCDCIISTVLIDEVTYSNELKNLFNQNPFFHLDDEKIFNAMDAEVTALLKDFSFTSTSPIVFDNLESDLSVIVIPQEISDLFSKFYDYFFGNHDHQ